MRILVLSWEYPPFVVGGMGKHVTELLPTLGGVKLDDGPLFVDVVTTRYAGGEPVEQLNDYTTIHRVAMQPIDALDLYNSVIANNAGLIEYALALGEQTTYDLIHVHDWLPGEAAITLKLRWKTPLVATIHATERGRHQGNIPNSTSYQIDQLEWRICYEAWRVIVCSQFMCEELHNFFGLPSDKIDVIPNGVHADTGADCTHAELQALRQRFAPNGERLLYFVGRITHEKGLQILIRAMPRIVADYPNTRLLVAGKNSHKMWPLAYELGVEKSIDFLGFIDNRQRDCLYRIVDAAVIPSLYEPFGIVALEAMAAGCNVIVSDVGGLREVVNHRQNGLTALPDNPQSIVWAVGQLFSHPEEAERWRAQAHEDVARLYNWEKIGAQTARIFERVVKARRLVDW